MTRVVWFRVAAALVVVVGLALAFNLPDACLFQSYPEGYQGYRRMTPDCESRQFVRILIAGGGVIVASALVALSYPRTSVGQR